MIPNPLHATSSQLSCKQLYWEQEVVGGLGWLLVAELGWWDRGSVGSVWDCRVEPGAVYFLEARAIKQVGTVDVFYFRN